MFVVTAGGQITHWLSLPLTAVEPNIEAWIASSSIP